MTKKNFTTIFESAEEEKRLIEKFMGKPTARDEFIAYMGGYARAKKALVIFKASVKSNS